jgi:hypothetical protein
LCRVAVTMNCESRIKAANEEFLAQKRLLREKVTDLIGKRRWSQLTDSDELTQAEHVPLVSEPNKKRRLGSQIVPVRISRLNSSSYAMPTLPPYGFPSATISTLSATEISDDLSLINVSSTNSASSILLCSDKTMGARAGLIMICCGTGGFGLNTFNVIHTLCFSKRFLHRVRL